MSAWEACKTLSVAECLTPGDACRLPAWETTLSAWEGTLSAREAWEMPDWGDYTLCLGKSTVCQGNLPNHLPACYLEEALLAECAYLPACELSVPVA